MKFTVNVMNYTVYIFILILGPAELIEKLDRIMQDNEASLIAARAERYRTKKRGSEYKYMFIRISVHMIC